MSYAMSYEHNTTSKTESSNGTNERAAELLTVVALLMAMM
jgi:hypothetical protein